MLARLLALAFLLPGCGGYVARHGPTIAAETLGAAARELEQAAGLRDAASLALSYGDRARCEHYAALALRSEAVALPLARRSLYLAGLPYPGAEGDDSSDPGPAPEPAAVDTICGEVPAEVPAGPVIVAPNSETPRAVAPMEAPQ